MKKTFISFVICAIVAVFTSVSFVSCGLGEMTLESAIEKVNEGYPQTIDNGLVIEKITIEGEDIVYNCSLDPSVLSIEMLDMVKEPVQEQLVNSLKEGYAKDANIKTFIDLAAISGKNIQYKFTDAESGNSTSICVDNASLVSF